MSHAYTFEYRSKDSRAHWIQSPIVRPNVRAASEAAALWLRRSFENGFPVEVRLIGPAPGDSIAPSPSSIEAPHED